MKYKVLIVDDELAGIDTLKYLINWNKTNFSICDTARNGKEALKKFIDLRPDLIVTDIQMPVMDGLDFIRQVKNINPNQKVIILSCHENFYYAKQSIALGVSDYLVKDLLTEEGLVQILDKVENNLNNTLYISDQVRRFTLSSEIFKAISSKSINSNLIDKHIYQSHLDFKSNTYVMLNILMDDSNKHIPEIVNREFDNYLGGEVFQINNSGILGLFCISQDSSDLRQRSESTRMCQRIRKAIASHCDLPITLGVSQPFDNLLDMPLYSSQAIQASKQEFFLGKDKNIFYSFISPQSNKEVFSQIEHILQLTKKSIDESNLDQARLLLQKTQQILSAQPVESNYIKKINFTLFNILITVFIKHNIPYEDILCFSYMPFDYVESLATLEEVYDWFLSTASKLLTYIGSSNNKSYSSHVSRALSFIEENYCSPISLETISNNINVHKGYLCRIFKQETGQNITDFIINLRIEKAKKLISSSNLKLYQISEEIGFSSPAQLSLYFKRITKLTPTQWQEEFYK